jgi:anti-anti-sigma factor
MEVSAQTRGAIEIMHVSGNATADGHELLRHAVRFAIHCGRKCLVFDLRDAGPLDSLTIGELVASFKRAREEGGDLKLVIVPGGRVHELLELCGLDRIIPIFGETDEALAAFD